MNPRRFSESACLLGVLLVLAAAFPARAGLLGINLRKECMDTYVTGQPIVFLTGYYYELCRIRIEQEPKKENGFFLTPILKPKECEKYGAPGKFITPTDLEICRDDRWKARQKWVKCRLEAQETPEEKTDHAVELVISGGDSSKCGPYADKIMPRSGTDSCVWPICPFWTLMPNSTGSAEAFSLHAAEDIPGDSSAALCADIKDTVNDMIALYDADHDG